MKSEENSVRVLGEALIAAGPDETSYIIYLNSLNSWEVPAGVILTETEKQDVVNAIRKHFLDLGSDIEFE